MNKPVRPVREGFVSDEAADQQQPSLAAEAKAPEWPIKVKLIYRAIRGENDQEIRELTFREPSGGDINRYGCPVRIDSNGEAIIDERKMSMMMAVLSGVLSPFLDRMDPRDWQSCAYRLRGFFLPDPAAW
jgi:hypothetical protein